MPGGIEDWLFLDVDSRETPDGSAASALPGGGKGRIVALAATPAAQKDAWASRAAALLAEQWAREGLHVFLMDLGLEDPSLHLVLGLPNGEGVSEAFLFGSSVEHIAKPALDGRIFFSPAGASPGDPEEVLGHPRWASLVNSFSEADATLLLFLPTDIPGAAHILARCTDIVLLAGEQELPQEHLGPAGVKLAMALGPRDVRTEEPGGLEHPGGAPAGGWDRGSEGAAGAQDGADAHSRALDFDFEGELELAEGFGLEPPSKGLPAEGGEEAPVEPGTDRPEGAGTAPTEADEGTYQEPAREETGTREEKSGDLLAEFGVSFGGGPPPEEASSEETEEGVEAHEAEGSDGGLAPEFDVQFVDLPPLEAPPQLSGSLGEFGEDLVQGPDFGTGGNRPEAEKDDRYGASEMPEAPPRVAPEKTVPRTPHPRPPRRKPPKRKIPVGRIGLVALALAVVIASVGTASGILQVPGFGFLRDFFSEVPDPPLTLAGPQPNEDILTYSLVIFTFQEEDLEAARDMLDALEDRLPELLLTLVPSEVDGERVHTLLAGPAVDRVEAENLRGPIAEVLTREDPDSWSVRETPRAFYLGERGTLPEAENYLASVESTGLQAYILHVTFPDPEGSESFLVLTGAFAGVQDARHLQLMLRERGFPDAPLIERRGRLP